MLKCQLWKIIRIYRTESSVLLIFFLFFFTFVTEMHAKYALALILALQVSVSLCEIPDPPQELVDKYNEYKGTFYKRLLNLLSQAQTASGPMVEQASQDGRGQAVREYAETLQAKPEFQAFVKVATALGEEASPLVDKARLKLLGAYQAYLRPYVGEWLADTITEAKVYLDKVMPAE
uniref:Apolipoprotein A-II n=2 Tax=Sparus aurata TaxID=8175 RepID=A0A671WM58_SPAAU